MSQKLTLKQEAFCLRYIETGNATEAYRLAYDAKGMKPASVSRKAFELLENVKITAYLAELKARQLKRHDVTVDRVLQEYARLAFLDIRKAFDPEGNLRPIHELDDDTAAAIAGLEVEHIRKPLEANEELEGQPHGGALKRNRGTETIGHLAKIKLSDKRAALDSLARHLGMFVDRSEVTHRKPIAEMTEDELNAEIAEYERTAGPVLPGAEG